MAAISAALGQPWAGVGVATGVGPGCGAQLYAITT